MLCDKAALINTFIEEYFGLTGSTDLKSIPLFPLLNLAKHIK